MNAGFNCSIKVMSTNPLSNVTFRSSTTISGQELGITADFRLTAKLYVFSLL